MSDSQDSTTSITWRAIRYADAPVACIDSLRQKVASTLSLEQALWADRRPEQPFLSWLLLVQEQSPLLLASEEPLTVYVFTKQQGVNGQEKFAGATAFTNTHPEVLQVSSNFVCDGFWDGAISQNENFPPDLFEFVLAHMLGVWQEWANKRGTPVRLASIARSQKNRDRFVEEMGFVDTGKRIRLLVFDEEMPLFYKEFLPQS